MAGHSRSRGVLPLSLSLACGPAPSVPRAGGRLSGPRARVIVGRVSRAGPTPVKYIFHFIICHRFLYKFEKCRSRVLLIQKS
jgi:hypothetical protein